MFRKEVQCTNHSKPPSVLHLPDWGIDPSVGVIERGSILLSFLSLVTSLLSVYPRFNLFRPFFH